MSTIDLKPKGKRANVIRAVDDADADELRIPMAWMGPTLDAGWSLRTMFVFCAIDAAERTEGVFPTDTMIFDYCVDLIAANDLDAEMALLFRIGLLYWYEDGDVTRYILVKDFTRMEPEKAACSGTES